MKTTILLLLASFALALGAAIPSEIANNPTFYSETPDSPHEFLPGAHSPSDPVTFPPKNRGLLKRKCTGDFPYQTCWASASRRLAPPRLLTLPTLIISTITNVPGTLAAAIPSVDSLVPDASKTGLQKNEEAKGLEERGCGRWDFPYIDCSKSAGSSLAPPRMLSLPTLLFTSVANIPRALAAAIPAPKVSIKDTLQALYKTKMRGATDQKPTKEKRTCKGEFPYQECWALTGSRLAPPRILQLPTLLITTLSNLPRSLAPALPTPSFPKASLKDTLRALYNKPSSSDTHNQPPKEKRKNLSGPPAQPCWASSSSSSSHLVPPRILSLPSLLLTTLLNLPGTFGAVIPDASLVLGAFRYTPRGRGVLGVENGEKGMEMRKRGVKRGVKSYDVAGKVLELVERGGGWYFHELSSEAAKNGNGKGEARVLMAVVGLGCAGIGVVGLL